MKKPEGSARLIKFCQTFDLDIKMELWEVKFIDDGFETTRLIKRQQ